MHLPLKFKAAGIAAGIKKNGRKDMAMLVSEVPASAAAVFTVNKMKAAPVIVSRRQCRSGGKMKAVVVNSGNANACTGAAGLKDAESMVEKAAASLGVPPAEVLVCSTGSIGVPLPMDCIMSGIERLADSCSENGLMSAAEAVMTTDTHPKVLAKQLEIDGKQITLTGLAKGAGMIEPHMATMLAFILTDAGCNTSALQSLLEEGVNQSFNRISIDGDQSTNDTVMMLANGAAGNEALDERHPQWSVFAAAVRELMFALAMMIVQDGEGAKKCITVAVRGAASVSDAEKAARAVARSFLVKTGWSGPSSQWGRIMDVLGYCGAAVDPDRVSVAYDDVMAVEKGTVAAGEAALRDVVGKSEFTVTIDLHIGSGHYEIYTCEITEEYVRINQ